MRPQSSRFVDFAVRRNSKVHELVTSSGRRVRLFMVAGGALCWVLLVMWRLASLQIIDQDRWQEWAVKQHLAEVKLASERGPVYDRRGRLLAVSVPAGSVYVRPAQVRDVPSTVQALAPLVELSQSEIRERLGRKSPFVWLDRQIPRARAQQIADLKLPGVGFVIESLARLLEKSAPTAWGSRDSNSCTSIRCMASMSARQCGVMLLVI